MDTCALKVKSRASGKFWYLASEQEINVKESLIVCCLFYLLWALSISLWSCWNTFLQLEYLTQLSSPHWKRNNVKVCTLHSISSISTTKRALLPPVLLLCYQISKVHLFRIDIASYSFYFYSLGICTSSANDTKHCIHLLQTHMLVYAKCFVVPNF